MDTPLQTTSAKIKWKYQQINAINHHQGNKAEED